MERIAVMILPFAVFPFFLIVLGAMRLFTPFALLYALPAAALIVLAMLFYRSRSAWSAIFLSTAVIGAWLLFLVFFVSSFFFPPDLEGWGRAGFPFASLRVPSSMYGSDTIPIDMWLGTFANEFFWYAIAMCMSAFLIRKKKFDIKKFLQPVMMAATMFLIIIAVLMNIGMFTIWFD